MNLELTNRIAMIAAASKGLGKATAIALAQEGCKVSICARNEDELQRAKEEIGANCFAMRVDVSKLDELEKWHAQTRKHFGGEVDILVTNTGGPPAARFMQLTDELWQTGVDSTLMNVVRLCRMVIPAMQAKKWGRIIHITSLVAKEPLDDLTISSTLRAGLSALTKTMANQLGPDNITVNAVLPGHIRTDRQTHLAKIRSEKAGITPEQYFDNVASHIPLRRIADPRELGEVVTFVASERASYISGASLLVDGGITKGAI